MPWWGRAPARINPRPVLAALAATIVWKSQPGANKSGPRESTCDCAVAFFLVTNCAAMPATSPAPTDKRPGPASHASGDEEEDAERRSLLAPDPSIAGEPSDGPGSAASAAVAFGRPSGPDLFVQGAGLHQPICGGRCVWVQGGDDACDMTWFSALVRSAHCSLAPVHCHPAPSA